MNINAELDRHQQRLAEVTEYREVYHAVGQDTCARVMDDEIKLLKKLIARLMAERAQAQIAARKEGER